MAMTTAEDFFAVLEKSRLLDPEQMDEARAAGQSIGSRSADDPTAIAKALVRGKLLTRWQAGQLLAGRGSFFLGKYKLIGLLAPGATGSVFLGEHVTMNRRVALKTVSRKIAKDPAALKRFLAGARTVATLDHPNIVHAYSFDNQGDRYYIVMEHVNGSDLQQIVEAQGPLDYRRAADAIRQAADGLAHGHQNGVVHGDVKPSNLLVTEQGVVKIADMGLVRLSGRGELASGGQDGPLPGQYDENEKLLGSVDYMSPEMALEDSEFDHRADVYSLGCTLCFLLTGRPPFPDGLLHERLMKHQSQPPPVIRDQRPDVPKELAAVCRKMMAKRPEDRFQSAEALSETLAAWRPAEQPAKRAAGLKVAEALGTADSGESAAEDFPAINVRPARGPVAGDTASLAAGGTASLAAGGTASLAAGGTASLAAGGTIQKTRPPKKAGFLQTPQQKIVAVAGLAFVLVALLVVLISLLGGPQPNARKGKQSHTKSVVRQAVESSPPDMATLPDSGPKPSGITPSPVRSPENASPAEQPEPKQPTGAEPEVPKPEDPEPENPEPEGSALEQPEPEDPQPVAAKPSDPPPKAPRPQKPKPIDPLGDLPPAVSLPVLDAKSVADGQPSTPARLATLHVAAEGSCDLRLVGGKDTGMRNREFRLQREDDKASWLIQLESHLAASTDPQQTDVARIGLDGNALTFQWLGEERVDWRNQLRKCGLSIHVGGKTRWLPFVEPTPVEPLVIGFDTGMARTPLPADAWMPKPAALKFEVTEIESRLKKAEFDPADRVSKDGKVVVLFRKEGLPNVELQIELKSSRGRAQIGASADYLSADKAWYRLAGDQVQKQAMTLTAGHERLKKLVEQVHPKDPRREAVVRQRDAFKRGSDRLRALGEVLQDSKNIGTVYFRVFMTVGEHKVVLFTTSRAKAEQRKDKPSESPNNKGEKRRGG